MNQYIHSFLDSFLIYVITEYWVELPVLHRGPCWLCILYRVGCVHSYPAPDLSCSPAPPPPPPHFPFGNHKFVFYVCESAQISYLYHFFLIPHLNGIIWYLSFSVWLSRITSRSIHVAANSIISFFFVAEWYLSYSLNSVYRKAVWPPCLSPLVTHREDKETLQQV